MSCCQTGFLLVRRRTLSTTLKWPFLKMEHIDIEQHAGEDVCWGRGDLSNEPVQVWHITLSFSVPVVIETQLVIRVKRCAQFYAFPEWNVAQSSIVADSRAFCRPSATSSLIHCSAATNESDTLVLTWTFATEVTLAIRWYCGSLVAIPNNNSDWWEWVKSKWVWLLRYAVHDTFPALCTSRPPNISCLSPLVDSCRTTLLLIYHLALQNPSFSPKTDLISMSRKIANIISAFSLAIAAPVATAKRVTLEGCFHFCFFFSTEKLLPAANDGPHCLFGGEHNELKWNWLKKIPWNRRGRGLCAAMAKWKTGVGAAPTSVMIMYVDVFENFFRHWNTKLGVWHSG